MNIATTKGVIANPKNKIGWYGGGFASFSLRNKFYLQSELLYSSKGERTHFRAGGDSKSSLRLNYINLPILIGYKIDSKTSLLIGPEFGYLITAQLKYYSDFFDVTKNYPSKYDIGIDVGIKYLITKNVGSEIRYSYGLNTLYYVDELGTRHSERNGANRMFQIGVNYLIKNL